MSTEEFTTGRALAGKGDHAFFIRLMTGQSFSIREDQDAIQDFYFGTDIRKRHTANYVMTFEKLLKAAREVDTDDMISNALLLGSASGRQYRVIKYVQEDESFSYKKAKFWLFYTPNAISLRSSAGLNPVIFTLQKSSRRQYIGPHWKA